MSAKRLSPGDKLDSGLEVVAKSDRLYFRSRVFSKHYTNGEDVKLWAVDEITVTEARKRHTKRRGEAKALSRPVIETGKTLRQAAEECWAHMRADLTDRNRNTDYVDISEGRFSNWVVKAGIADLKLEEFTRPVALRFLRWLKALDQSHSSRNGILTTVRRVLRHAREMEMMEPSFDPFKGIARSEFPDQSKRAEGFEATVLDNDQVASFLRIVLGERFNKRTDTDYSNIVIVSLLEGHRSSEACGLRWSDWDPETQTLAVNGQLTRTGSGLVETKTGKTRGHKVHAEVAKALTRQRQVEWAKRLGQDDDLIFTRADGSPITRFHLAPAVKRAAKLAGLGHLTPRDLRRTFCTAVAHTSTPPVEAAARTGHSLRTWETHYVKPLQTAKQQTANQDALEATGFGDLTLGEEAV